MRLVGYRQTLQTTKMSRSTVVIIVLLVYVMYFCKFVSLANTCIKYMHESRTTP